MVQRTALLISCSAEEAETIRAQAKQQRRSISGYMLNILMRAVEFEASLLARIKSVSSLEDTFLITTAKPGGHGTVILLRCSATEATLIRKAAQMRQATISGFVRHCLNRSWRVQNLHAPISNPEMWK